MTTKTTISCVWPTRVHLENCLWRTFSFQGCRERRNSCIRVMAPYLLVGVVVGKLLFLTAWVTRVHKGKHWVERGRRNIWTAQGLASPSPKYNCGVHGKALTFIVMQGTARRLCWTLTRLSGQHIFGYETRSSQPQSSPSKNYGLQGILRIQEEKSGFLTHWARGVCLDIKPY